MPKNFDPAITPPYLVQRAERACDDDWITAFLQRAQIGHIATRWDEQLFITPVNFWYDPEQHEIYFHTSVTGRLRANCQRHPQVCFEACEVGRLLPSNVALEFSVQYESAVVFGEVRLLDKPADKERALYGLIQKYFPDMEQGVDYRPITPQELRRTAVFAIAIQSWSGKRNWPDQAEQSPDWPLFSTEGN